MGADAGGLTWGRGQHPKVPSLRRQQVLSSGQVVWPSEHFTPPTDAAAAAGATGAAAAALADAAGVQD